LHPEAGQEWISRTNARRRRHRRGAKWGLHPDGGRIRIGRAICIDRLLPSESRLPYRLSGPLAGRLVCSLESTLNAAVKEFASVGVRRSLLMMFGAIPEDCGFAAEG